MAPDLLAYLWPAASYGLIESRALSGSSLKQYSRSGSGSSLDTDQLIISPLTIPSCHRAALPRHSPSTTLPPQPCHPFRRLVHIANSCPPPPPPPPCHPWCVHNDGASLSAAIRSTVTFATSLYPALFARGPFKLLPNAERAEEAKKSSCGPLEHFYLVSGHIVIPDIVKRGHTGVQAMRAQRGLGGWT